MTATQGGHLRPVVAADERRGAAPLGNDAVQHVDGVIGVDPAVALDRQRLAGELVHDVQQLEVAPVGGLIPLKVDRPHMIGSLGRSRSAGTVEIPSRWRLRAAAALDLLPRATAAASACGSAPNPHRAAADAPAIPTAGDAARSAAAPCAAPDRHPPPAGRGAGWSDAENMWQAGSARRLRGTRSASICSGVRSGWLPPARYARRQPRPARVFALLLGIGSAWQRLNARKTAQRRSTMPG